jgi:DNA-binding CsgD family transcriptional regulator
MPENGSVSEVGKRTRRVSRDRAASGLHLTAREREALALVLRGETNKEIALRLGLAQQTAKELVSELLHKFHVPNRAALAEAGARLDLVGESVERSWLPQLFREASVQIAVTRGAEHRYVVANGAFTKAVGRDVLGKTMRESFPDLEHSGYFEVADRVYQTGVSVVGHAAMAMWDRGRGPELTYTDAVLQALRGDDGEIEGLAFFGMDVTEQVIAAEKASALSGGGSVQDPR